MSLQQTALRLPEGGDEWVLADQQPAPDATALQQQQPEDLTPPADAGAIDRQPITQAPPALSDLERVALEQGWTPKDQWRGDPTKHVGAAEYLRTTARVLDRTKNELKQTRRQTDELNARLARVELGQHTIQEQTAQALFEEYEDAKFQAAQAGDTELYRKLTKEQQDTLAKVRPAPQAAPPQGDVYAQAERIMEDPIAARFFEANPIALQDERAWSLMDREMSRVHGLGQVSAAAQFKAAEEALRYAYPDAYARPAFNGQIPTNTQPQDQHHSQQQPRDDANGQWVAPQQRRPAPPMSPATPTARPNMGAATAVDRLPADARAHLNKEVAAGKVKNQELWAKAFLNEKISYTGAKA